MQLVVVEPDHLTRWSMEEYLRSRYAVCATDNTEEALRFLRSHRVDAVIVSDDLPSGGADVVEQAARSRNPQVRVIRTMTQPCPPSAKSETTVCLEKPFPLSVLAGVLEVPSP